MAKDATTNKINVLPEDFTPTRRGRVPRVQVDDLLVYARENPGLWVSQKFDSESEAASAMRQLKTHINGNEFDVVSKKEKDGAGRTVFVKQLS